MKQKMSLEEYVNKFVLPYLTKEFIEGAMLIPYLPLEKIEEEYPEAYDVWLEVNKKNKKK